MKKLLKYLPLLFLLSCGACSMAFQDEMNEPSADHTAIVSVRQSASGTVYFQVDDQTRLLPSGDGGVFKGLERIICGLRISELADPDYGCHADVIWFEALDKGTTTSDSSVKGEDPVGILSDWMTSCEDGYLTLHYETWWGEKTIPHAFYLVTGLNPEDPYEVWLRHDAKGDGRVKKADSLVFFDLQSLPETENGYVTLTLKWLNGEGQVADRQFSFRSRPRQ